MYVMHNSNINKLFLWWWFMANIINRDTIGDMARRGATKYGDKTAMVFYDTILSFYDLEKESRRFSHLMLKFGIRKGDKVAVLKTSSHLLKINSLASNARKKSWWSISFLKILREKSSREN